MCCSSKDGYGTLYESAYFCEPFPWFPVVWSSVLLLLKCVSPQPSPLSLLKWNFARHFRISCLVNTRNMQSMQMTKFFPGDAEEIKWFMLNKSSLYSVISRTEWIFHCDWLACDVNFNYRQRNLLNTYDNLLSRYLTLQSSNLNRWMYYKHIFLIG